MRNFFLILLLSFLLDNCKNYTEQSPVHWVDPNIGGISHSLQPTVPTVHVPNSMVRISPVKTPGIIDRYLAQKIYGFPLNIPSHRGDPVTLVMPFTGNIVSDLGSIASEYDHDFETVTSFYYSVFLEDHEVEVEVTPSMHSSFYSFDFQKDDQKNIMLIIKKGDIEINEDLSISGFEDFNGINQYFYIEIDHKFDYKQVSKEENDSLKIVLSFYDKQTEKILLKSGVSYISTEQAKGNLKKEIPEWDFRNVKETALDSWNKALNKIQVKGGTDKQKRIFYTALYRCYERMVNISEENQYFSGYDHQIHKSDDFNFYVDDWIWDTYRSLYPLQIILNPRMELDMIKSYIKMYEQSGWIPSFPMVHGDRGCMIGNHATAWITDAYFKGIKDFDIEKAYEGLKKNAMQGTMIPWAMGEMTELGETYLKKGFFPALPKGETESIEKVHSFEKRQSVAVTLEHAYDDWCLAQLAKELDQTEEYEKLIRRSKNYKNLYHPETGFMTPKTADGKWVEDFDPKFSGGQGGREYFAEVNSWTYTWHVQHDVEGLIDLMGGKDIFVQRLDKLFNEPAGIIKFRFLSQFPDASGLTGQFVMGDEQSFHIPYLYNYAGQPWKTQKKVRFLMDTWYDDSLMGICGDEDGGGLSSWYVFSAMGFYPVCPGKPIYQIGSPIFEEVTIQLPGEKKFIIQAKNVSDKNKYIQSANLNGKKWDKCWFSHTDLINGGKLVFEMGSKPNKSWGITSN